MGCGENYSMTRVRADDVALGLENPWDLSNTSAGSYLISRRVCFFWFREMGKDSKEVELWGIQEQAPTRFGWYVCGSV